MEQKLDNETGQKFEGKKAEGGSDNCIEGLNKLFGCIRKWEIERAGQVEIKQSDSKDWYSSYRGKLNEMFNGLFDYGYKDVLLKKNRNITYVLMQ